MQRGRWAILAVMVFPSIATAESPPPVYPSDVQTFIERVAMCADASKNHLVLPHKYWNCRRLADDRARLAIRYRENPKLIQELSDHWVLEVRRVSVKIQSP